MCFIIKLGSLWFTISCELVDLSKEIRPDHSPFGEKKNQIWAKKYRCCFRNPLYCRTSKRNITQKPVEVHFSGRAPAVYQRKPGDQQSSLQQFQAIVWHHCRPGRGRLSRNRMFLLPASCLSAQICVPTLGEGWLIFMWFYSNTPYKINTLSCLSIFKLAVESGVIAIDTEGNFLQVFPCLNCADYFKQLRVSIKPSTRSLTCVSRFPVSLGEAWLVDKRDNRVETHKHCYTHIVWDKKPQGELSAVYRHWKASLSGCPTFQDEQKRKWVCLLLLTQQEWHRVKERGKVWRNWSKASIFWLLLWTLANPDRLASLLQFTSSLSDSRKPAVWSAVRSLPSMLLTQWGYRTNVSHTHTHTHARVQGLFRDSKAFGPVLHGKMVVASHVMLNLQPLYPQTPSLYWCKCVFFFSGCCWRSWVTPMLHHPVTISGASGQHPRLAGSESLKRREVREGGGRFSHIWPSYRLTRTEWC